MAIAVAIAAAVAMATDLTEGSEVATACPPPLDISNVRPFRARSASKGDGEEDDSRVSVGRGAGDAATFVGADDDPGADARGAAATFFAGTGWPLSNCSIGNKRWACTIFKMPSSRWNRCSLL